MSEIPHGKVVTIDGVEWEEAFKFTNEDMSCNGFKYEMNKVYTMPENEVSCCNRGFHACLRPADCLFYYGPNGWKTRFFKVLQAGKFSYNEENTKRASSKIMFVEELTYQQVLRATIKWHEEHSEESVSEHSYEKRGASCATGAFGSSSASGYRGVSFASGVCGSSSASCDYGASSASGDYGTSCATGVFGASSATGNYAVSSASGVCGASLASGDYGTSSATGNYGVSHASGDYGTSSATGYKGTSTASGVCGSSSTTDYRGTSSASGEYGTSSSTGNHGVSTASGNYGTSSVTGYKGTSTASGNCGGALSTSTGGKCIAAKDSVAVSAGFMGRVMAKDIGAVLVVVERGPWDGTTYPIISFAAAVVDGEKVKPNVWYTCKDSQIVQCEEDVDEELDGVLNENDDWYHENYD